MFKVFKLILFLFFSTTAFASKDIQTHISEPKYLEALETKGLDFGHVFGVKSQTTLSTLELFQQSPIYQQFYNFIHQDIEEAKTRFKSNRSSSTRNLTIGTTTQEAARLFNSKWLSSKYAKFELVGVINRLDRADFNPQTCGELRLIYRLAYNKDSRYSRLPLTINVVYNVPGSSSQNRNECKKMANNWFYNQTELSPEDFASWVFTENGPLASKIFNSNYLKSVEINLQAIRIPSSLLKNMGGSGEYLLRVFKIVSDTTDPTNLTKRQIVRSPLENTPDIEKIKSNPELWTEFKNIFKDRSQIRRINAGIFNLPEKFLTYKISSFSPYGFARIINRPYDQLLTESDLKSAEIFLTDKDLFQSAKSALLRLNDMSCVGCHQARATAGFHFLGIDKKETFFFNSIVFEGSGHFMSEVQRRKTYLARVIKNLYPKPYREFSFSPSFSKEFLNNVAGAARYQKSLKGDFCGLEGRHDFSDWSCSDGLKCEAYDEDETLAGLGKCVSSKTLVAGDACEVGSLKSNLEDLYDDKHVLKVTKTCGGGTSGYSCREKGGGFPAGMCANGKGCINLKAGEICGHAAGDGFNNCIASIGKVKNGKETTFVDCVENTAYETKRGVCDRNTPCRNDYVCSKIYSKSTSSNTGACLPSYFLFQVRADGHPSPE